jgi:hypothetical protein
MEYGMDDLEKLKVDLAFYKQKYEESLQEENIYCNVCGSCCHENCCSPDRCQSVKLYKVIKDVLKDMEEDDCSEFDQFYFIDQLQDRFRDGDYCKDNLKSYGQMEREWNIIHEEHEKLKKDVLFYEQMLDNAARGYRSTHSEKDWICTKRSYVEKLEDSIETFLCFVIDNYERTEITEEKMRQIYYDFLISDIANKI